MGRRRGAAAVGAVAVALLMLSAVAAAPALAAGTGGVELVPVHTGDATAAGGRAAFHLDLGRRPTAVQAFDLRNLSDGPMTTRVYPAAARRQPGGGFVVGGAGTAPWIALPASSVRLGPRESRRLTFTVRAAHLPPGETLGAVVMQPVEGSSLVVRVATMVYVTRADGSPSRPAVTAAGALAAVMVAGVATGLGAVLRRRRHP